ncbi:apolipoprotein acyltransferase [Salipiger sp. CCB-MM3]|uniref:apolipoprotein acyltransferase n=1 Tax=Salipiger sp. CCB-MM3 TaxID=1792508 RepID=UPI00080ABDC9|nr:apolipoprotein acyltransferase [Salipiger sp. CCB-MM3]ANT61075.1 apolipoprotein acyltransferase [Salipiger sp. CCB-MM3]
MIVIAGALLGAIIGGLTARRRKGNKADIAQFVAVYAIAFGLVGLIVTIAVEKLAF